MHSILKERLGARLKSLKLPTLRKGDHEPQVPPMSFWSWIPHHHLCLLFYLPC